MSDAVGARPRGLSQGGLRPARAVQLPRPWHGGWRIRAAVNTVRCRCSLAEFPSGTRTSWRSRPASPASIACANCSPRRSSGSMPARERRTGRRSFPR